MQTVEAVRYLHQNDILHRDLKVNRCYIIARKSPS